MRVTFWQANKDREHQLGEAFVAGARAAGDEAELRLCDNKTQVADADVACMVGVKCRKMFLAHRRAGVRVVYFDKGYARHRAEGARTWEYWRVAVDAHQPTSYLMSKSFPGDRFERLNLELKPWRSNGESVVFAGSSAKYHAFYRLPDPTSYAKKIIRRIAKLTGRPVIYRPKPSWREAVPVEGAGYSQRNEGLGDAVAGAYALVTHGSNACFESVLAGVPCIILGEAVAKPISSTALEDINLPRMVTDAERLQWLRNLAYQQWSEPEMASGEAWRTIRGQITA